MSKDEEQKLGLTCLLGNSPPTSRWHSREPSKRTHRDFYFLLISLLSKTFAHIIIFILSKFIQFTYQNLNSVRFHQTPVKSTSGLRSTSLILYHTVVPASGGEAAGMYRDRLKGLYVVARNFFMLLLNCSAWPCLGPT